MSGDSKTTAADFETMGLTAPEQTLWRALEAGEACLFDEAAPERDRTLNGDVLGAILRQEVIADVEPPSLPRQVKIAHAIITGVLDMSDTRTGVLLVMEKTRFEATLNFARAEFAALNFYGSHFKCGALFNDFVIKNFLWLDGIECDGELSLPRAKIGGQFSADNAQFSSSTGFAIHAQGAQIKADVYLRRTNVTGCVDINDAKIGGQFSTTGAQLSNPSGKAIHAQGAQIKDSTWLNDFQHPPIGEMDLTNADLGHMIIDANSYPLGPLFLQGTRYRSIDDWSNADKVATLDGWLRPRDSLKSKRLLQCYAPLMRYAVDFHNVNELTDMQLGQFIYEGVHKLDELSQDFDRHSFAYRQFARVLKANGHEPQARDVRIEAEHAYTTREGKSHRFERGNRIFEWLWKFWRWSIKHLIAYGIKPWRVLPFVLLYWGIGIAIFYCASSHMTPAKERFYLSDEFQVKGKGGNTTGYTELSPDVILPKGYPNYSPIVYALDVMLPIVDFAQESHWRPKNTDGWWNWLRIFNRVFLSVGWALSTIAVLGFTGVISDRRDED